MAKTSTKILACLCAVTTLFSAGGVYATWKYVNQPADAVMNNMGADLGEWPNDIILPGGSDNNDSQSDLLKDLLSNTIGLNNKNSNLSDAIDSRENWGRDTIGSMAMRQGGDLTSDFQLVERGNLNFIVQFESSNVYYIYTWSGDLGKSGEARMFLGIPVGNKTPGQPTTPIGSPITEVYRTRVVYQNGEWVQDGSPVKGYALSAWYAESQSNGRQYYTQIPAWDCSTWKEGDPA
ncbi:MAG: hypothetical protein IJX81_02770 [Clostridia bacterium]|nr:hypothetical protein [Clostridia bacterium]